MIRSINLQLKYFSPKELLGLFAANKSKKSDLNESSNKFIVYLLRGKKLYSFLFDVDHSISSVSGISLKNKIVLYLPLTVISDNRIDNEDELGEYLEDIVGFFDVKQIPSLLLLDPSYFFNIFIDDTDVNEDQILSYSPHIASDTSYCIERSTDNSFFNLSFCSSSLLESWGKCLKSTGADCAFVGSFMYPVIEDISTKYSSFAILDVHNSYSTILLSVDGKILSKYLPFGVNQYLNGQVFMAEEFVNRLSKTIVKFSSDNSLSSPKNIFYLSDQRLDKTNSRFFNLVSITKGFLSHPVHSIAQSASEGIQHSDSILSASTLISIVSLSRVLDS